MSDRSIAKQRFHKGVSGNVRRYMRRFGVSMDEEAAQFALGGRNTFDGIPRSALLDAINLALRNRSDLMRQWEAENPNRNPYPPPFPERVIKYVDKALQEINEDGSPVYVLSVLRDMCVRELDTEPVSVADSEEEL